MIKRNLILLAASLIFIRAFGQSEGPDNPASASYSAFGCLACPGSEWNNWNNIMVADSMYATVGLQSFPNCFQGACYYSRYLIAKNFGFTIPASATITGVKAGIIRMSATSPNIKDTIVQIFTGGNYGTNHADSTLWTPSLTSITYGDSTDLWGLVLTPDSVNSGGFGFWIMIRNKSLVVTAAPSSVDNIQLTVYYLLPTGVYSQTHSAEGLILFPNPAADEFSIRSSEFGDIKKIEIYNVLGEKVFSERDITNRKQVTVDVSSLSPGFYFAVIDTGKEKITQKVIVQR